MKKTRKNCSSQQPAGLHRILDLDISVSLGLDADVWCDPLLNVQTDADSLNYIFRVPLLAESTLTGAGQGGFRKTKRNCKKYTTHKQKRKAQIYRMKHR